LDVEASWKNAQEEDHICPSCGHGRAKFVQMQTRSADEAATIFFKCCNCGKMSKEN
jgi:DNA-directed RNA polymerase III subunit RPC11